MRKSTPKPTDIPPIPTPGTLRDRNGDLGIPVAVADPPMFEDRQIVCQDCGQSFLFSGGEQTFYADRQLSVPKRCPSCRQARKKESQRRAAARMKGDAA